MLRFISWSLRRPQPFYLSNPNRLLYTLASLSANLTPLSGAISSPSPLSRLFSPRRGQWSNRPDLLFPQTKSTKRGVFTACLATTEACDSNAALLATGDLRVLHPIFQIYGKRRSFSGPITTVKVFEDNVLVRELLETRGEGRVLVIDGAGSMGCALLGGNIAQLAHNMGWVGIVVNGCIRDIDEINGCDIGVRALASHPKKSNKKGHGEKHVPVHVAGTLIRDGEWLYADIDGVIISKTELSI